ncbi:MAG: flavin reductase family protein [Thermoplasmata archaeon]|nr:flavin reductase family protein [Thermoplasmata archaeon]
MEVNLNEAYRLFPAFPVTLVTCGKYETTNIITIGMCHIFSFSPPLIGFGVAPKRHSFKLLKEHKEFVVNLPTKDLADAAMKCGSTSGKTTDKFRHAGLTKIPSKKVNTGSIKECPLRFECITKQEFVTGDHTWFVGEIVHCEAEEYRKEDLLLYWGGEFRVPGNVVMKRA